MEVHVCRSELECASSIFAALELSLPLAFVVTIVVEMQIVPLYPNLGTEILNQSQFVDYRVLYAMMGVPAILIATAAFSLRLLGSKHRYNI